MHTTEITNQNVVEPATETPQTRISPEAGDAESAENAPEPQEQPEREISQNGQNNDNPKPAAVENDATDGEPEEQPDNGAGSDTISRPELERLVGEAYLKGRNEAIAKLMEAPLLFEQAKPAATGLPESTDFLSNRRRSIWDVAD